MPLVEVRRAIYAYTPADGDELAMREGDVLYILNNDDADWLQAKRKVLNIDDPEEQGLVPANHTELIKPITRAKGLYDYEPTLAEETTLNVDEEVDIVEDDDPEWYMAKTKGGYGFVPKAYVEIVPSSEPPAPELPAAPELSPAVALPPPPPPPLPAAEPPTSETLAFDLPAFSLPAFEPPAPEPAAVTTTTTATLPPPPLPPSQPASEPPAATISHFNVMLGKKKKAQKITLGVSNPTLIVDSNEDTVPPKRFATGDISKCVVKKSVLTVEIGGYQPTTFDFNCTSNGEAERISDSINAARRGMFIGDRPLDVPQAKEAPASMPVQTMTIAQEHARVLYDFASDDSEELAVAEGDRVLVLDKSDAEWWQVQLAPPHGRAGLVPAAYVELCHDKLDSPLPSAPPALPAKDIAPVLPAKEPEFLHSPVEQPDLLQFATDRSEAPPLPSKQSDAIPQLPMRQPEPQRPIDNSIIGRGKTPDSDNMPLQLLQKPAVEAVPALPAKGPDPSKVRTWTDGSGAYTVEAEFLRLDNDGNVHLHKTNGKTITVAMAKFSDADRRYVAGLTGQPPKLPTKSKTARQRQQEQAQQTPGRRIINYDWDWFDFFTLKCGVTADNALKYATSFVAERLDDASIPEIDANYMRTLGVKPADIPRLERAILEHQGKAPPEPAKEPVKERAPSPRGLAMEPASKEPAPAKSPASVSPMTMSPMSPIGQTSAALSPINQTSGSPRRAANNPWGVDSELDRRFDRRRQIEEDEAFARKLQEDERKQPRSSRKPLNLGVGSRKLNKSQTSVVDPAQLRTAQQRLGSPLGRASSPPPITSPSQSALDQAFGPSTTSPRLNQPQMEQVAPPPPRARPTARAVVNEPALQLSSNDLTMQRMQNTELTPNHMAAAAASGNTAQMEQLDQMAKARAQELAQQEARIRQQQEEIRKQAMFLQQQQQQLVQMQQSQKVEAQLKQLREDKERLEKQRQNEELQKQVAMLRAQQQQMLKMQQMASQARAVQPPQQQSQPAIQQSIQAVQPVSQPMANMNLGMATPMTPQPYQQLQQQQQQQPYQQQPQMYQQQQPQMNFQQQQPQMNFQQQQQQVPLSSRLPPPLVPTQVVRPAVSNVFSNPSIAGSTPNLGNLSNYNSNAAAAQSMSNFNVLNQSNKYDLFKSINPQAPSIFSSMQPSGPRPTGVFAMPNPTLNQQQPQMNFQQQQQQQFNPNSGFGGQQPQWR